jgi:hypothetical protein
MSINWTKEETTFYATEDWSRYTSVFFDDDFNNFKDFKDTFRENPIKCIMIDPRLPNNLAPSPRAPNFVNLKCFDGNDYVERLKKSRHKEGQKTYEDANIYNEPDGKGNKVGDKKMEEVLPNKGFESEHMIKLEQWFQADGDKKTIIFDWDRTLSVVNSPTLFLKEKDSNEYDVTDANKSDIVAYLMAGSDEYNGPNNRLKRLKDFFAKAFGKKVKILILTRNSFAEEDPASFVKLAQVIIGPHFGLNDLIFTPTTETKCAALLKYYKRPPTAISTPATAAPAPQDSATPATPTPVTATGGNRKKKASKKKTISVNKKMKKRRKRITRKNR